MTVMSVKKYTTIFCDGCCVWENGETARALRKAQRAKGWKVAVRVEEGVVKDYCPKCENQERSSKIAEEKHERVSS